MNYRNEQFKRRVVAQLGEDFVPPEATLIENLDEFPEELIETARTLGHVWDKRCFVACWLPDDHQKYVLSFVTDVLNGQCAASQWRRGAVLLALADDELPGYQVDDVLAIIDARPGETLYRRNLSEDGWNNPGAPATVHPDMTYRDHCPRGAARFPLSLSETSLEPIGYRVDIAIRRWVANAYAWLSVGEDPVLLTAPVEKVLELVFEGTQLSPDGAIAIAALHCELKAFGPLKDGDKHGYRGPDQWYMPPS